VGLVEVEFGWLCCAFCLGWGRGEKKKKKRGNKFFYFIKKKKKKK